MSRFILSSLVITLLISCGTTKEIKNPIEGTHEISCGMCNFDMTGDECALAVRIDDKTYYVEGSTLQDHGDEHADDGLCTGIRKAKIKGQIKRGVFMADSIKILPMEE